MGAMLKKMTVFSKGNAFCIDDFFIMGQNTEGSRHLVDFTIGNEKKGRTIAMAGGDVEENDCFQ